MLLFISHPPYSPDLSRNKNWLIADLMKILQGKKFGSSEEGIAGIYASFESRLISVIYIEVGDFCGIIFSVVHCISYSSDFPCYPLFDVMPALEQRYVKMKASILI